VVVGDPRGGTLHVLHQSVEIVARIGDAHDADSRAVPYGAGVEFRDRDIETAAQPVFQAAQNLPLILERLRRFDVKFEREESDHAAVVSG